MNIMEGAKKYLLIIASSYTPVSLRTVALKFTPVIVVNINRMEYVCRCSRGVQDVRDLPALLVFLVVLLPQAHRQDQGHLLGPADGEKLVHIKVYVCKTWEGAQ